MILGEIDLNNTKSRISYIVILLGLVSLLNDVSSEIIMAILPMFIMSIGGTTIGIGAIGGLEECLRSLLSYASGKLSDKMKRRLIFVFSGYGISSCAKLLLTLASHWVWVLAMRIVDRGGKAIRSPARDAMIAQASTKENIGFSFGIHRAMDTAGAVLGSLFALLMFWYFNMNLKYMIFIGAIIAFFSLIPLLWVKEDKDYVATPRKDLSFRLLPKKVWLALIPIFIYYLANFTYMFFLLKVNKQYTHKMAIGMPLLMYLIFNISYTTLSAPAGYLSDKLGRKKFTSLVYFVFALTCAGFSVFHSNLWFIILFFMYGLAYALVEGNQRAYITELSTKSTYGSMLGIFYMISGIASLIASLLAGILWTINPAIPCLYAAALSLIAAFLFHFFHN